MIYIIYILYTYINPYAVNHVNTRVTRGTFSGLRALAGACAPGQRGGFMGW